MIASSVLIGAAALVEIITAIISGPTSTGGISLELENSRVQRLAPCPGIEQSRTPPQPRLTWPCGQVPNTALVAVAASRPRVVTKVVVRVASVQQTGDPDLSTHAPGTTVRSPSSPTRSDHFQPGLRLKVISGDPALCGVDSPPVSS